MSREDKTLKIKLIASGLIGSLYDKIIGIPELTDIKPGDHADSVIFLNNLKYKLDEIQIYCMKEIQNHYD